MYTRRLDRYEFKELPATEGVLGIGLDNDSRGLRFVAPVSPGALTFTDGRIIVVGERVRRGRQKRADYILR